MRKITNIKNIFDFFKENPFCETVLIYVKLPYCGYCQAMKKEWDELCKSLKDNKKIALVELDKSDMANKHGFVRDLLESVTSVPNISRHKRPTIYNGERTKVELSKFSKEK
jgi:thiol-disulfide isomerase/thioredoxin